MVIISWSVDLGGGRWGRDEGREGVGEEMKGGREGGVIEGGKERGGRE